MLALIAGALFVCFGVCGIGLGEARDEKSTTHYGPRDVWCGVISLLFGLALIYTNG